MFAMSKAFFELPADVKGRYGFDQVHLHAAHATLYMLHLLSIGVNLDVHSAIASWSLLTPWTCSY